jgi:4-carboxymuconolactone decarboxylase
MMKTFRFALVLVGACALGQQARFPQLKVEDTAGAQRTLADHLMKETRVGLGGPWNIMLRSPNVGESLVNLYHYFRWDTKLGARLVEFGILVAGREAEAPYEWFIHYPLALKEGVSAAVLADVKAGKRPVGAKPDELAAYDLATEILRKHVVSDATFARAKAELGEQGVVDISALVGTYSAIGGMLNLSET